MHYIVYVSQAEKPMTEAEIEEILTRSRDNNAKAGITGLLVYRYAPDTDSGHFMQMLEGEEPAVRKLYERIVEDPRHHTKIVLEEGDSPGRMFGAWSMGFKNINDKHLKNVPGYARLGEHSFDPEQFSASNPSALVLLRFFYDAP